MANSHGTAQRLRELLHYDPDTGIFTRKIWRGGTSRVGSIAGANHGETGYLQMSIDGRLHFAHRLAWLYVHGEHPKHNIDHINGDRKDNRISNLRDVPQSINLLNRHRSWASTGVVGVHKHRDGFTAKIQKDGKAIYLGRFMSIAEAKSAYDLAKVCITPPRCT